MSYEKNIKSALLVFIGLSSTSCTTSSNVVRKRMDNLFYSGYNLSFATSTCSDSIWVNRDIEKNCNLLYRASPLVELKYESKEYQDDFRLLEKDEFTFGVEGYVGSSVIGSNKEFDDIRIDLIIEKEGKFIGYGSFYYTYYQYAFDAYLASSYIFPKVNGEFQDLSFEQVTSYLDYASRKDENGDKVVSTSDKMISKDGVNARRRLANFRCEYDKENNRFATNRRTFIGSKNEVSSFYKSHENIEFSTIDNKEETLLVSGDNYQKTNVFVSLKEGSKVGYFSVVDRFEDHIIGYSVAKLVDEGDYLRLIMLSNYVFMPSNYGKVSFNGDYSIYEFQEVNDEFVEQLIEEDLKF